MKPETVVRAIVFGLDGKLLLLRRSKNDSERPGDYDFPGGGIEPQEHFETAIARETQEESGLDIEEAKFELVYAQTALSRERHTSLTRLVFVAHVDTEVITLSNEHIGYSWVTLDEAIELFRHPVYTQALQYIKKHGLSGH